MKKKTGEKIDYKKVWATVWPLMKKEWKYLLFFGNE